RSGAPNWVPTTPTAITSCAEYRIPDSSRVVAIRRKSHAMNLDLNGPPNMTNSGQRKSSQTFQQALLRSEKKRAMATILFLATFEVLMFVRIFVFGSAMSRSGFFAVLCLIGFEFWLLRRVGRALSSGGDIPDRVWYLSVTLESLLPAVGVAFLTSIRLP